MCNPAIPMLVMVAASTAMSVHSAQQQGKAAQAQANYQAAVALNNQTIANRQAEDVLKQGEIAAQKQRDKTRAVIGRQLASFAAQGTAIGEGSPLDILGDLAAAGAHDEFTIRYNADREAYERRLQGDKFQADSALAGWRGASAKQEADNKARSSLLSGASQAVRYSA